MKLKAESSGNDVFTISKASKLSQSNDVLSTCVVHVFLNQTKYIFEKKAYPVKMNSSMVSISSYQPKANSHRCRFPKR